MLFDINKEELLKDLEQFERKDIEPLVSFCTTETWFRSQEDGFCEEESLILNAPQISLKGFVESVKDAIATYNFNDGDTYYSKNKWGDCIEYEISFNDVPCIQLGYSLVFRYTVYFKIPRKEVEEKMEK